MMNLTMKKVDKEELDEDNVRDTKMTKRMLKIFWGPMLMPKDRWIILIAVVSFYFVQFRKNIERPKKLVFFDRCCQSVLDSSPLKHSQIHSPLFGFSQLRFDFWAFLHSSSLWTWKLKCHNLAKKFALMSVTAAPFTPFFPPNISVPASANVITVPVTG